MKTTTNANPMTHHILYDSGGGGDDDELSALKNVPLVKIENNQN